MAREISSRLADFMDGKQRVGLNLQRMRRSRGFSQEELADRAKLHQTYISGIERGLRNPTVMVIDKLADALDTDPGDLVTRQVAKDDAEAG